MLPNLAIYLDELSDDPLQACAFAKALDFKYVVLRQLWSTNTGSASDQACQRLAGALRKNGLQPIMIASECGLEPADQLPIPDQAAARAILIAAYFRVKFIRFFVGKAVFNTSARARIDQWMYALSEQCGRVNIKPILEVDQKSHIFTGHLVVDLLNAHPGWGYLYDPVQLVAAQKQDPYERYWLVLKAKVSAVDLHDVKIGRGFVTVGNGDCYWAKTAIDIKATKSDNRWYFVEHGLGLQHRASMNKFQYAQQAITAINQLFK